MTTSISSNKSVEASPQSFNSSQVTGDSPSSTSTSSSSWSNNHHSLLEQEDGGGGGGGRGGGSNTIGLGSNESAFTNPSSFGSMSALLNNNHAQQSIPLNGQRNLEQQINESSQMINSDTSTNSAFDQGTSLARLAWVEMDAEIDSSSLEWRNKAVNSSSDKVKGTTAFTSITTCPTYCCARCGTTLALQDELISKAFSGRDGKAFLFFSILNAKVGPKEDRQLLTGLHTVADLNCNTCQRSVGWCYLRAFEASQRYKEGKFILERAALHKTNNWQL